ncbi:hypothetical protein C2857_001617 [Epichloe festucae Fl1]|uniref:Uncharacterized protein n=1 Tax=Epichloe festucae (strain Fl1) TaxID=877507 RepID=A0A7U3SLX9_EPIFF|nr:hypothetical protein C2857_001617 [Epichloe festucae Fl1]
MRETRSVMSKIARDAVQFLLSARAGARGFLSVAIFLAINPDASKASHVVGLNEVGWFGFGGHTHQKQLAVQYAVREQQQVVRIPRFRLLVVYLINQPVERHEKLTIVIIDHRRMGASCSVTIQKRK